jgi:Fe-S-cluster containining protein
MRGDPELVQIVDRALAEAVRKSGSWLLCRPGCHECCIGPFPITQLDAARLREGLTELHGRDPQRAARVRGRAQSAVDRIRREFPAAPVQTVLEVDEAAGDELCPALDPATGTCDLYTARPITCRTFGPAVRLRSESLGICELCYRGATDEQIAACEVVVDPDRLESELIDQLERTTGPRGETIVAFALLGASNI